MNDLNKLYKAMLLTWGCVIKPDHRIMLKLGEEEIPIKVDDMNVYLPVSEALESHDSSSKVFFHPACENVTSKETEIFKIIRRMAVIRMLELFKKYPVVLVGIANGKEKRNWNQNILDILEPLKGTKKSVLEEVKMLISRFRVEVDENGQDNRFIHLKCAKAQGRSQTGSGEKVYYKTKPVFPVYNEVIKRLSQSEGQADNQTVELNGYSISRAALKLMAHLFRVILPAVNDPDLYTSESTNAVAARLVSYCGCFEMIAEQLNRIQHLFRADFDKLGIYPIDLSWTEQLEELPETYRQIPALDYNTHNTQEENAQHSNLGNMGSMFSVNSNPSVVNTNINNNQNQQQQQPTGGVVNGFNTTPPPMLSGDRWIRCEIDTNSNQVIHHAINTLTNVPVIYYCTRSGSMMMRTENPGAAVGGIPGIPVPGMGAMNPALMGMMNPALMGMAGLTPQMLLAMQMGQMSGPATTSGTTSVVQDSNNGNSSYVW